MEKRTDFFFYFFLKEQDDIQKWLLLWIAFFARTNCHIPLPLTFLLSIVGSEYFTIDNVENYREHISFSISFLQVDNKIE